MYSIILCNLSLVCCGHNKTTNYFALYFQGRTALWDSLLLVCHRIKTAYGGIVRGMHLGSSALAILPVLEPEIED